MEHLQHFTLEESAEYADKYQIRMNIDTFNPFMGTTSGSYHVMAARLMNLDYPTYLRFCRDILGAELIGRNELYVRPVFDLTEEVRTFVKILNKRADYIMSEAQNPYEYYRKEDGSIGRKPFNEENN